jgi:hypothetical protein
MERCDTPSAARSAQRGNVRRPTYNPKKRLVRTLRTLAKSGQMCDRKMLRDLQKCPDSPKAAAILTDALAHAKHVTGNGEYLSPDASWIHPLV